MDVTSSASISSTLESVQHLTDGVLHFLLSNVDGSESNSSSSLLDADLDAARREYEINVWGMLALTQAFFPLLRIGKGVVVNQSSVAGSQGYNVPFMGVYTSSQAAVRSLSDTLRVEYEPFGVRVVVLVTPNTKTKLSRIGVSGCISESSIYAPVKGAAEGKLEGEVEEVNDQEAWLLAERIVEEILKEPPPKYIRRGHSTTFLSWLYWLCPMWLLDWLNVQGFNLHLLNDIDQCEDQEPEEEMKRD